MAVFVLVFSAMILGLVIFHLFGETVQTNPLNLTTLRRPNKLQYHKSMEDPEMGSRFVAYVVTEQSVVQFISRYTC